MNEWLPRLKKRTLPLCDNVNWDCRKTLSGYRNWEPIYCNMETTPSLSNINVFLLLILMLCQKQAISESKGYKLSFCAEGRIRTQGLWNRISSKVNVHCQTDWTIEDQAKSLCLWSASIQPTRPHSLPVGIRSWLWQYTCSLLLILMLWHREAIFEWRKENVESCLSLLIHYSNPGYLEPNLWQTESPLTNPLSYRGSS